MQAHAAQPGWLGYVVPIAIVAVVMALRLRRMGKARPLKLERLWVVPSTYVLIAGLMFVTLPPVGWVGIASAAGLIIGAALGWQRGKMMHIEVDPETHALNHRASPAAMFFLIALIIVRSGARAVLGHDASVSPAMLTDPLIAFAVGMFTLQRVEMYQRAKRLLEEARGRT